MIGSKYGLLTPLRVVGRDKFKLLIYECQCDCGNIVNVKSRYLTDGKTKSCGCLRSKSFHHSNDATYKSWISAKQRCYNPHNHNYPKYGGRGIKMSNEWRNSFAKFLNDMGERPNLNFTLDRIDVNGDYECSNCRWADKMTQGNNRRNNHIVVFNGKEYTASQFSRISGVNLSYLYYCFRKGMIDTNDIIEKFNNRKVIKAN